MMHHYHTHCAYDMYKFDVAMKRMSELLFFISAPTLKSDAALQQYDRMQHEVNTVSRIIDPLRPEADYTKLGMKSTDANSVRYLEALGTDTGGGFSSLTEILSKMKSLNDKITKANNQL